MIVRQKAIAPAPECSTGTALALPGADRRKKHKRQMDGRSGRRDVTVNTLTANVTGFWHAVDTSVCAHPLGIDCDAADVTFRDESRYEDMDKDANGCCQTRARYAGNTAGRRARRTGKCRPAGTGTPHS